MIFTDALRLNQVIENLTSNAIKYTERGEVNVDYFIEKGKVLNIVISDTGKGIPKDKLKFIFKPFTRVVDSKSTVPIWDGTRYCCRDNQTIKRYYSYI
uniref:sensor histidine kinase n=1 Tax=Salmonella enterica TaxID=28901 RepID=UPI0013B0A97F|nr:ATP-binding protein [Salmonella enterica]QIC03492.1 Sensor histidine kinase RcsC [Salmonella enterica subsp. enterica serovar London]